jgi:hypothetical protein
MRTQKVKLYSPFSFRADPMSPAMHRPRRFATPDDHCMRAVGVAVTPER